MGNVSAGDNGGLKKSNYYDILLWGAQQSFVRAFLSMPVKTVPVFESKRLFEGGANVTEQVSQTVTNW